MPRNVTSRWRTDEDWARLWRWGERYIDASEDWEGVSMHSFARDAGINPRDLREVVSKIKAGVTADCR